MMSTNFTRPRSSSSASDDPARKRMTHITMRLKNAFRISPQPPFPMQTRSMSLPPISCQRLDDLPRPASFSSRPLSCVVERPMDAISLQEEEEEQEVTMDIDVPELTDSTAGIEYPDPEIMQQDPFNYERQTEWVDTSKHWYSDYLSPFKSNTVSPTADKKSEGGILKHRATLLGKKRAHPSSQDSAATKKKKRIPVIRFDKMVQVHSTYSHQDYNRHPDPDAICTRLNATLAHQIKEELNLFKTTEMPIHEQSKLYTQIFL